MVCSGKLESSTTATESGKGSLSKKLIFCDSPFSRTEKSFLSRPSTSRPSESFTVTGTTTKSTDLWKVGSSLRELLSELPGRFELGMLFALSVEGGGRGCSSGDLGKGRSPLLGAGAVLAGKEDTGLLG